MKKLIAGFMSMVMAVGTFSAIPVSAGKGSPIGVHDGWFLDGKNTVATRFLIGPEEDKPIFGTNEDSNWEKLFPASIARVTIQGDYFGYEGWEASGSIVFIGHMLGWGQIDWTLGASCYNEYGSLDVEKNKFINKIYVKDNNKYTIEVTLQNLLDADTTNADLTGENGFYTCEKKYGPGLNNDYAGLAVQSFNEDAAKSWNIIGFELADKNNNTICRQGEVAMGENILPQISSNEKYTYTISNNCASILKYNGYEPNVTIPNIIDSYNVTTIVSGAFNRHSEVKSLTIPNSITQIQHSALSGCANLKDIYYDGLKNEWNKICNDYLSENITIHFKEHNHEYESETVKYPTCTSTGIKECICKYCYDKHTETIAKLPHKNLDCWVVTDQATFTENGSKCHICLSCGHRSDITVIPKLIIPGTVTDSIPKETHDYKKTTINSSYFAKGYTGDKCTKCNQVINKTVKPLQTMSAPKMSSNSTSSIKLTWAKVKDAKGYVVYQNGKKIKMVTGTSLTVTKLKAGTTYKYTVKPYNIKNIYGNQSKTLTATTKAKAVTLKATAGKKKATLKWNKVTGATGYNVYYKTSSKGKWIKLKSADNKTTSYTKTKLSSKKTYWFKVDTIRKVEKTTYTTGGTTKSVKIK